MTKNIYIPSLRQYLTKTGIPLLHITKGSGIHLTRIKHFENHRQFANVVKLLNEKNYLKTDH